MKVYQAINAVQAEIGKEGIAKDGTAQGFGAGYKFRGIDSVYNALSPLLAKHGLVIIPRCLERHESVREGAKSKLYFVAVKMEFDFISAEDGSKHTACTYGEAMDSGDKATNKAMSIAYKYACFQTFAIPTEGDNDPDATVHEPAPARKQQNKSAPQAEQIKSVERIIADINVAQDVKGLADIRDYVAARQYSDADIGGIKLALKKRHDAISGNQTTANGLQLNDGFKAQA